MNIGSYQDEKENIPFYTIYFIGKDKSPSSHQFSQRVMREKKRERRYAKNILEQIICKA